MRYRCLPWWEKERAPFDIITTFPLRSLDIVFPENGYTVDEREY